MQDALSRLDVPRVVSCAFYYLYELCVRLVDKSLTKPVITSLQQPSGTFAGDRFGETDTRFLYIAVQALSLLGKLEALDMDGKEGRKRAVEYIERCRNFDGGFGAVIDAESHSGQGKLHFENVVDVLKLIVTEWT